MKNTNVKQKIRTVLEEAFDAKGHVYVSDGYKDFLHVRVMSSKFKGKSPSPAGDLVWDVLFDHLKQTEWRRISLVIAFSPDRLNGHDPRKFEI